jgi:Ribonuclease G/E
MGTHEEIQRLKKILDELDRPSKINWVHPRLAGARAAISEILRELKSLAFDQENEAHPGGTQ